MSILDCKFLAQRTAEKAPGEPSAAMISITNPGEFADLQAGWGALLRIRFADVEYDQDMIVREGRWWPHNSQGFPDRTHALAIRGFINGLPADINRVVVHCHAGVSRSAAVAKWIAEQHGLPFDPAYQRYNKTVYLLLRNPVCFAGALAAIQPRPIERPQPWWKRILFGA